MVDTRETWRQFFSRQLNFEDPPLVPREELPEDKQPHRSFYGKLACFLNNIDPYPPKCATSVFEGINNSHSFSARTPLHDFIPPPSNLGRQATRDPEDKAEGVQQLDDEQEPNMKGNESLFERHHKASDEGYAINGEPERMSIVQEEDKENEHVTMRHVQEGRKVDDV